MELGSIRYFPNMFDHHASGEDHLARIKTRPFPAGLRAIARVRAASLTVGPKIA